VQSSPPVAALARRGLSTSGPLAAAVALVADGPRVPLGTRSDPAAFLAQLMDLHGSVSLARELDLLERRPVPALDPSARAEVRALTEERIAELVEVIDQVFAHPFQRRNKLPDAEAVLSALELSGALPSRSGQKLASAAGRLWEPFGELAARTLGRIRRDTRTLRDEIAPFLRALGPDAARLERLDAALSAATQKRRDRVLGELVPGLARRFSRGLRAAVLALPEPAGAEHVAAWFGPEQWLPRELERMSLVVRSALAHEAGRLLALVEGATAGAAS
jgi:hypothetical protein